MPDDKTPPNGGEGKGPPAVELFTLEELAKATGNYVDADRGVRIGRSSKLNPFTWEHRAAAQLHGWDAHALATTEPLKLSVEDYQAALKAATEPFQAKAEDFKARDEHAAKVATGKAKRDDKCEAAERCARHGRYVPHKPALSKFAPKGRE